MRTQALPEVFREVWRQYERKEHALADGSAAADGGGGDDDSLDMDTLQARLRRRMRHSMHVMMQQANPDSYYATNVVHPDEVL